MRVSEAISWDVTTISPRTFQKILVPVDFSEPSKKAVACGLTLAAQFNAKLIIAHVVPESSALAYAFPTETSAIETQQREKASQEIQNLDGPGTTSILSRA